MAIDSKALEPEAAASTAAGEAQALFSIAISMKRIADAMEVKNEYGERPAEAIGAGIARALRHVGNGR